MFFKLGQITSVESRLVHVMLVNVSSL